MKTKRRFFGFILASILLLSLSVPAGAAPNENRNTVDGYATSVVVGADDNNYVMPDGQQG